MGRRAFLAWRKSRTSIVAALLVIAIVAYGLELYSAYQIGPRLRPHAGTVRIMGADAQSFAGAVRRRRSRAIVLNAGRKKRIAYATWVFSEYATRALRRQLDTGSPNLVIDAVEIAGALPAGISVQGCFSAGVRAVPGDRIVLPLRTCPMDRTLVYSVSVRAHNASWLVRSVALQAPETSP